MKVRVNMHRIFMWYRKERVESVDVDIDLSQIPEIKEKEKAGFVVHDVRRL